MKTAFSPTRWALAATLAMAALGVQAQVKIAYIDPLSGGGASVGEHGLKHLQFLVDGINAKGGVMGGQKLEAVAKAHFAPLLATRPVGVTLQIDEGPEVFDAKNSSLHPLFQPKA